MKSWITLLSATLMLSNYAVAKTFNDKEILQMPNCLAAKLSHNYSVLSNDEKFTIISVPSKELNKIVHTADKVRCGRFINITDKFEKITSGKSRILTAKKLLAASKKPQKIVNNLTLTLQQQTDIFNAVNAVNTDYILATLTHLTNYYNRSATATTGVEAIQWVKDQFEMSAKDNQRTDIKTYFIKTGLRYKQPSLVTVLGKDIDAPAVVIGAHIDTLDGRMPGAGDDGSGSACALEISRVLMESKMELKRPVYIIWYAAEERGLVGSQYVVRDFLKKDIPVAAVMQLDMTGYRTQSTDPTMWLYRDYTDSKLTSFVAKLIQTYINVPVAYSRCGYGCSDHASWTQEDIPAVFPCESDFEHHNSNIHTAGDTIDRLTPEHMSNFAKLGVAFALELAAK